MSSSSAPWICSQCGTRNTNRKVCGCGQKFRHNGKKGRSANRKNGGQYQCRHR